MAFQIEADASQTAARGASDFGPTVRLFAWADLLAVSLVTLLGALTDRALGAEPAAGALTLAAATGLAMALWFRSLGHYRVRQPLADQVRPVIGACALAFLASSTAYLALGASGLDAGSIVKWALAPGAILGCRLAVREALKASNAWAAPVTLFAPRTRATAAKHDLSANDGHGLYAEQVLDLERFAALDEFRLSAALDAFDGRIVFLAPDDATQTIAARIAERLSARGACFYYRPAVGRIPTENVDVLDFPPADGVVFRIGDSLDRPLAQFAKRAFDVMAASLALIALSPVFALIAWGIRRDGGPAFFVQPRVGAGGGLFGCYKFRSMAVDAEARLQDILAKDPAKTAEWNAYQKLEHDPRITRVGAFLRMTSLDELPQLINVLRGEMSLVGPRPMTDDQREQYGASLEAYVRMRPGITGLWQVNGRNSTTFEERARLDDWYARNWSLWRDVVILFRTVREVALGSGR